MMAAVAHTHTHTQKKSLGKDQTFGNMSPQKYETPEPLVAGILGHDAEPSKQPAKTGGGGLRLAEQNVYETGHDCVVVSTACPSNEAIRRHI